MIQAFIDGDHRNWDLYLPRLAIALRSAVHESTGFSPAALNLGRELWLPLDNELYGQRRAVVVDELSYEQCLREQLEDFSLLAAQSMARAQANQKLQYDRHRRDCSFTVGDQVLLRTHFLSKKQDHFMAKLAPSWEGPFEVEEARSAVSYKLADQATGKDLGVHHISHLRPFHTRAPTTVDKSELTSACAPGEGPMLDGRGGENGVVVEAAQGSRRAGRNLPRVDYAKYHRHGVKS